MNALTVWLKYSDPAESTELQERSAPTALPVHVYDTCGDLGDQGVASTVEPAYFALTPEQDPVFVRLEWPSGRTQTERASFGLAQSAEITFTDTNFAGERWSAWAIPRLYRRPRQADSLDVTKVTIADYNAVWLRLWQFTERQSWDEVQIDLRAQRSNDDGKQIDLELARRPYLLQFGGTLLPWQLVSLPGGGACRVLITPTSLDTAREHSLSVVVTGFSADAEMLLEFLSRNALEPAMTLGASHSLQTRMMRDDLEDPIATLAWAYLQLQTDGWREIELSWFESLSRRLPWIPDTAAMYCVAALRHGVDQAETRRQLVVSVERGVPLFAAGLSLLREVVAVLRNGDTSDHFQRAIRAVDRLA